MAKPDYVVIRRSADLPPGFVLPRGLDGTWFDRAQAPLHSLEPQFTPGPGQVVATPTGRFEVREDGAVAEVWEVNTHRPPIALPVFVRERLAEYITAVIAVREYGAQRYAEALDAVDSQLKTIAASPLLERFGVDRAEREIDSKRRLIEVHQLVTHDPFTSSYGCRACRTTGVCTTWKALAANWNTHPDYREEEWRP